jgi:hypothetical protein
MSEALYLYSRGDAETRRIQNASVEEVTLRASASPREPIMAPFGAGSVL